MELTSNLEQTIEEGIKYLSSIAYPMENTSDLDPLMELIKDAKFVLLGESTHGTHEFYTWRARLTKRLIQEKKFSLIAVEGDWPDCYRINRYVKNYPTAERNAKKVLQHFKRWPTWMWSNWETMALMEWIRTYNYELPNMKRVGFYGLDVYSLWESMDELRLQLKGGNNELKQVLRQVMDCFEPFSAREGSSYAQATQVLSYSCEREVQQLLNMIHSKKNLLDADGESIFNLEQNALITANAELYYRTMLRGDAESWNIRDRHMMETLDRLMDFHGTDAKVIVWEHNSHIGDARATDMQKQGMINLGQLAKEEHEKEGVIRIGFGTNKGTVLAGTHWGGKMRVMEIPRAKENSWEHLLHEAGAHHKIIISSHLKKNRLFRSPIEQRAIGVVYRPEQEHLGNYVPSIIPDRYEAFVYLDETSALHHFDVTADTHQMPETYPFGL